MLVEGFAPWCPHCQHFAPEVERIGQAFNGRASGVLVCRVNCVAQRPICEAMGIRSFPTMYWGGTAEFVAAERTRATLPPTRMERFATSDGLPSPSGPSGHDP